MPILAIPSQFKCHKGCCSALNLDRRIKNRQSETNLHFVPFAKADALQLGSDGDQKLISLFLTFDCTAEGGKFELIHLLQQILLKYGDW